MAGFADVLRELCGGATYDELGGKLNEVVAAVRETRKVGELSLKLKVKINGEIGVTIEDEIKAKIPEPSRGTTVFFADDSGNLLRRDPRQSELPLRAVEAHSETLKEAN